LTATIDPVSELYAAAEADFERYQVLLDIVDECIDLTLNERQSGHPGGSRSKGHLLLATLLSGAMRWDLRRPWLRFADRFVLSAGHTVPLIYATLAVLNEGLRARHDIDADPRFAFPDDGRWALTWEDLRTFRHRGGLPGHAEMAGKTLFFKANTGPSGHGMPFAAGQALALKMAGAEQVKVFAVEGEGGLTPGATHEVLNSAFGLGLTNLVLLIDWNDFGIDERAASSVVHGTPVDWVAPHGWRVVGTADGMSWGPVTRTVLDVTRRENRERRPSAAWFQTRKGRGYGKLDAASHGSPHGLNSPAFWVGRQPFMDRYGVRYEGVDQPAPTDPAERAAQAEANLRVAISVLRRDPGFVTWLSDRLLAIAATVPDEIPGVRIGGPESAAIFDDPRFSDAQSYPAALFKAPGERAPNRAALGTWGAWVNSVARRDYGRPLFVVASADLAESTNIAGFAKDFGDDPGFGWYERDTNPTGAVLPQEITEFSNAGIVAGMASVNFARDPFNDYDGFWGGCSTYASFSYLKYGPMRLFSQLAQDAELRLGRLLWVAGHSGPETAEDSRTHFGIFETAVTQLFPRGAVIDLHPWEHNEVPVMLAAALATDVPIVALHLTRPPVEIPDRAALRMPSHYEAARGAYVLRAYRPDLPRMGTVFVRGTVTTANLVKILPELDARGLNVKIVAALSPQLFARQDPEYREATISMADRWDSMAITNGAFKLMADWLDGPRAREYSLSPDWDDRWRTGGSVDEVADEAHLSGAHIVAAIERFASEREDRRAALRSIVEDVASDRPIGS
jgi:transketolase